MKKLFIAIVVTTLLLVGCSAKKGESVEVGNAKDDFNVQLLFEVDSVRIYRFYDEGHARYFSKGSGSFVP